MCILFHAALVEGRGLAKGEIGMASLDLKRPELTLSQVCVFVTPPICDFFYKKCTNSCIIQYLYVHVAFSESLHTSYMYTGNMA